MSLQIASRDGRKTEALASAISQIEKQFGKGAIMRLGDDTRLAIEGISTGSLKVDICLGGKGFPRGRVAEVFGPEGSGKTTLCLTAIANAQRGGGTAAFIDAEHALDPSWARKIGVNTNELLLSQPDSGEQALEIAEQLVRTAAVDIVVVDSVAALVPKAELEGEMGEPQMGLMARLMSQALRKLSGAISKSNTCVLFINQIREKIGVMFGNPETTTGGRALKFYASVRTEVRRIGSIKEGDNVLGSRVSVHIVKNKIAPPFKKAEIELMYDGGISREGELLDLGERVNLLERSGAWYSFEGEKLGQGREQSRLALKTNAKLSAKIEAAIRKHFEMPALAKAVEEATPPEPEAQEEPKAEVKEKDAKPKKSSAKS